MVTVFRLGKTSNQKISGQEVILQTYHFSLAQFEHVKNGGGYKGFYDLDKANCLDCPYSTNAGNGQCYVHKFPQTRGLLSMLRSLGKPQKMPIHTPKKLIQMSKMASYIRFGTYGEPVFIPLEWIQDMVKARPNWTGYTHQWRKHDEYAKYFMASVHNGIEKAYADLIGWRYFRAEEQIEKGEVLCPSEKTTCSACGLCSGQTRKAKNIFILNH